MKYWQNILVILFLIVLYPLAVDFLGGATPSGKSGLQLATFTSFVVVPTIIAYLMYLYIDKVSEKEQSDNK
ncbi:hypothetical protein GM182_06600 [bacterium 3DAC]|jgi:hypothetical protein|nr:hypothetical protein [Dictyoglomota bacterium]UZN23521.1 hypothetical protein GM182_06600 [bacterium 3DAC]